MQTGNPAGTERTEYGKHKVQPPEQAAGNAKSGNDPAEKIHVHPVIHFLPDQGKRISRGRQTLFCRLYTPLINKVVDSRQPLFIFPL